MGFVYDKKSRIWTLGGSLVMTSLFLINVIISYNLEKNLVKQDYYPKIESLRKAELRVSFLGHPERKVIHNIEKKYGLENM